MKIKIKMLNKKDITELNVMGYIKLKNKSNKILLPNIVRIVTEPLPGFSGASTITIIDDNVLIGRIYNKTLSHLLETKNLGELKDTNKKVWIKLNEYSFDQEKTYFEIL